MRALVAATLAVAAPAVADTPFEVGVAKFQAGDLAGSLEPLSLAHAAEPRDADAALLLGIAYYRLGEPVRARPLLEQAERDGDDGARASARVFLGLIADDGGDGRRARRYFGLVARSTTDLAASGRVLLDRGGPERWSIVGIVRPGYDSNVALVPATASPGPGNADADVTTVGSLTVRPFDAPLVLDETASYRRELRLTDFDALGDVLGATYTIANTASLAYHFEASTLGGTRYELGHVVDAGLRHAFGEFEIAGRYTFAARDYAQAAYAGYTGTTHTGVAEVGWGSPATAHELVAGYVIERALTDDPTLTDTGNGGRVALRVRYGGVALHASLLALDRIYDELGRRDIHVRADSALYIDLAHDYGLVFGGTLLRNASTDADYDYTKWTTYAGVVIGTSH